MSGGNGGPGQMIDTYDPVLISVIRNFAPQQMAYDLCGVQPMTNNWGALFGTMTREEIERSYPEAEWPNE
jgi:hypothetical protein